MVNRSSVKLKRKTGVNTKIKISNNLTNLNGSIKVKKPLVRGVKISNTGNSNKNIKLTVNKNTRIRIKRA